jgi:hypothetical protein
MAGINKAINKMAGGKKPDQSVKVQKWRKSLGFMLASGPTISHLADHRYGRMQDHHLFPLLGI